MSRRAKRTRRGWRSTRQFPQVAGRPPAPSWDERLLDALGELPEDERVAAIRRLGAGDRDALAELGQRLGIGPPPPR